MKVYIAEKPSLGKALAGELAKRSPIVDRGREFQCGADWAVCWAAGHIFENRDPDYYIGAKFPDAPKGKSGFRWSLDQLPIQPGLNGWPAWGLVLDRSKKDLFATIKRFVAKATIVVNAGDVDREGQRLVDEIIEELKYKGPVRRVLCTANDPVTAARALADERSNDDFRPMSQAALARIHADWYCGMNLSRLLTLIAQAGGYRGTLPYGRVQTPVLWLVVRRDLDIENFKPVDYFGITAKFRVDGGTFTAKWKPNEGQKGLDEEGRLLDRGIAQQLQQLVAGQQGTVVAYEDKEKTQGPPLPFSIDTLRVLGIRKYGLTADKVTEIVQALYDAKYVSYPRSDCSYLPTAQHEEAPRVLAAVKANLGMDGGIAGRLDSSRRTRAWNDAKVTAHHAIIPTGERVDTASLPSMHAAIYREICLRYAALFMPDRRYRAVSALIEVKQQRFAAAGSTTIDPGWKALFGATEGVENDGGEPAEEGEGGALLPPMAKGQGARCDGLDVEAKKTEPPSRFTEDTLLEAMTAVHKHVADEKIRAIFKRMFDAKKDGDEGACGLGTAATRQTYRPKLIESGFLTETKGKGKKVFITSTPPARAYIGALTTDLAAPDMTALWEVALGEIAEGRNTYEAFMNKLIAWVDAKFVEIKQKGVSIPASAVAERTAPRGGRSNGGKRAYSGAKASPAVDGKACPDCGKAMALRRSSKGAFYGCTGYPNCKHTEDAADAA